MSPSISSASVKDLPWRDSKWRVTEPFAFSLHGAWSFGAGEILAGDLEFLDVLDLVEVFFLALSFVGVRGMFGPRFVICFL